MVISAPASCNGEHGFQGRRIGILDLDATTGNGCSDQVGTGFDTVGHDIETRAVETLDTVDDDGIGTRTLNLRTHGDQAVGQVDHFRLAGGVFQHAAALGQGRRHHDVLGAGHADHIEEEVRATQAAFRRLGLDVAAFHVDLRAHGLEPTDVQVDRTRADGATARQGDFGLTETGDHRTEHEDRGTHGLDQLVGGDQRLDAARIDFDGELFVDHRLDAHATEQFDHGGDVVQVRQVADGDRRIAQQGRGQDRQRRVLRTGNTDFAIEASAAGNDQFVHRNLVARRLRNARPNRPG